MARMRTRWQQKQRERDVRDLASAMGVNLWRIAGEALLNLENEGFETVSRSQRLDVVSEFAVFLIHMTDRIVYQRFPDEARSEFINALARYVTALVQDNRVDANGSGDYRQEFIDFLNTRVSEYAECSYTDAEGPGFTLKRIFGEYVRDRFGPRDRKWIPDFVIDAEVPKAMGALKQAIDGLLGVGPREGGPAVPKGGVWGEA